VRIQSGKSFREGTAAAERYTDIVDGVRVQALKSVIPFAESVAQRTLEHKSRGRLREISSHIEPSRQLTQLIFPLDTVAGYNLMDVFGITLVHDGESTAFLSLVFRSVPQYLPSFGNMFSMAGASVFLPFLPMLPTQILLQQFSLRYGPRSRFLQTT